MDPNTVRRPLPKKVILITALVLAAALLICFVLYWDAGRQKPMSAKELERFSPYLSLADGAPPLMELCAPGETREIGEHTSTSYTSDTLPRYLYQCETLTELTLINGQAFYIGYRTQDGMEVTLTCAPDGSLINANIYDPASDIYYYITSPTHGTKYPRFRNGSHSFTPSGL